MSQDNPKDIIQWLGTVLKRVQGFRGDFGMHYHTNFWGKCVPNLILISRDKGYADETWKHEYFCITDSWLIN